jgi:protein ImuB
MMCVWLPNWPIQRRQSRQPRPGSHPLLIYAVRRGRLMVALASHAAMQRGVRPGMPLAEALSHWRQGEPSPALDADAPRDDRTALRELARFHQRFSPLVALEEAERPECVLLQTDGCSHLFGGEQALAARVVADLRGQGLFAQVAVADTLGAAWGLAQGLSCSTQTAILPAGQQHQRLPDWPIEALRLPADTLALLHAFDLRGVKQLLRLPRAELAVRFGRQLLLRLDQALGDVPELLRVESFAEPCQESWDSDDGATNHEMLLHVLELLVDKLLARLKPLDQGVQRLHVALRMAEREEANLSVGLLQPSVTKERLLDLLRLRLERLPIGGPVFAVEARAESARLGYAARPLFDSGGASAGEADALEALIERLSSRLGPDRVLQASLRADPQPECVGRFRPWTAEPADATPATLFPSPVFAPLALDRPLALCPAPEPVLCELGEGTGQLVLRSQPHTLARWWGPERIETGWWRGREIRRDYFRVETTLGERYWLFRDLDSGIWHLHGRFA